MSTGIIYDPIFLKHDTGEHPENAGRLKAIIGRLKQANTWNELTHIEPHPASIDDLKLAHTASLISQVKEMAERGGGNIESDTVISRDSFEVSLYAAGATIQAVQTVVDCTAENSFALVRPPGHHATPDRAMGFCLFNNIAIAALYGLKNLGLSRVLILDWDVHHGNGTQEIFERDPRVCYISLHEWPHYPGTGRINETGIGNIVNIPLPAGCGDTEYLQAIDEVVFPVARRFKPELILVSAGFDGHWTDPLASMKLTTNGYAKMTHQTIRLATDLCKGRLAITLEGGYNLSALAEAVEAVFDVLLGKIDVQDIVDQPFEYEPINIDPLLSRIKKTLYI